MWEPTLGIRELAARLGVDPADITIDEKTSRVVVSVGDDSVSFGFRFVEWVAGADAFARAGESVPKLDDLPDPGLTIAKGIVDEVRRGGGGGKWDPNGSTAEEAADHYAAGLRECRPSARALFRARLLARLRNALRALPVVWLWVDDEPKGLLRDALEDAGFDVDNGEQPFWWRKSACPVIRSAAGSSRYPTARPVETRPRRRRRRHILLH